MPLQTISTPVIRLRPHDALHRGALCLHPDIYGFWGSRTYLWINGVRVFGAGVPPALPGYLYCSVPRYPALTGI